MDGAEAITRRDDESLTSGMAAVQLSLRVWVRRTRTSLENLGEREAEEGRRGGEGGHRVVQSSEASCSFFTNSFPFQLLLDDG